MFAMHNKYTFLNADAFLIIRELVSDVLLFSESLKH